MSTARKSPKKSSRPVAGKSRTPKAEASTNEARSAPAASRARPAGSVSLSPIIAAMRKRVSAAEAEAFAKSFYQRMGEDELPQHSADSWAALAADFLEFARTRKPGTARVRLFTPGLKSHGWESPHTVLQIVNDDMPFLVDSVTMALAELGIGVHVLGHPVVTLERDKAGRVQAVG